MQDNLLKIKNLRTYFFTRRGIVKAVDGVDMEAKKESSPRWSGNQVVARA
ncbi:hypothetical protein [Acetomicrobium sp.]|nr:hypothetical protein [Acetomicrobium sp.]MDR9770498.1 hypothetical protein [Acetomicrobium sp.]